VLFPRVARWIWIFGGLAFLLAAFRPIALRSRPWRGDEAAAPTSPWYAGDFVPDAVYPSTTKDRLPPRALTVGSWLESGKRPAAVQTTWFPVGSRYVRIFVAGDPRAPGCGLRADFRNAAGSITSVEFDLPNPAEVWTPWDLLIPSGTTSLRFAAQGGLDHSPAWIGLSEPFSAPPAIAIASYQAAQILATFALGLILLGLPGLVCARQASSPEMHAAILVAAGPLLLASIGAAAWGLGRWVSPVLSGETGAGLAWAALGWLLWRKPLEFAISDSLRRVLAIAALCALAAVANAAYSGGPEGELFRGEVRRTLAVGNRSDSETSYRVVQVVARGLSPFSADTAAYFAPWSFFSRGPLAGLAAAPLVFATGKPPIGRIGASWQPFDPWGYTSYRIAMAILAALSIVALFLVLAALVDETVALLGAAAMALCPFVLHEMMFTWPKLAATAGLLIGFLLAHRKRPALSGAALALAYLFHPMALLWTPWIGLWAIARGNRTSRSMIARGAAFAIPLLAVAAPWMAAGERIQKATGSFFASQSAFFSYFLWAEGQPAPWAAWLHSRWMNFSNTFLPFWLHFFHEGHADLNSIYGVAGPLVKFSFSWWNTLPLGMGLLLWAICSIAIVRAWRSFPGAISVFILGPAALLCLYWGDKSTGLMRECGHPLVPAFIAVAVIWFDRSPTRLARIFFHPAFPWLQLPGTLLMFWLTTLANPHPPASDLKALDPVWFALNVGSLAAIAAVAAGARTPQKRAADLASRTA
jgi:hypothetical protein